MAKLEKRIKGNFEEVLKNIEEGILEGSISATLEGSSDFIIENSKCSIRVFERYSAIGQNRVSLNVTLFQNNDSEIYISGVTSGGSQAMIFKVNTFGEEAFLSKLEEIITNYDWLFIIVIVLTMSIPFGYQI